jgi:hypothetical protein
VSTSVPDKLPLAVGAKSTPTTQVVPTANGVEVEQVVVAESILKFVLTTMLAKVIGALPIFWMVAFSAPSVVSVEPTFVVVGKVRVGGVE